MEGYIGCCFYTTNATLVCIICCNSL